MVLGFNHNIRYKGELFHVQTEDSGIANPHIITLLYRGGVILASAKTSYADIIKVEQLETVVESIMKEQHKDMMRRLKNGEFDARIFPDGVPSGGGEEQRAAAEQQSPAQEKQNLAAETAAASPAPQAAPAAPAMARPPQQVPPAPPAPTVPPASPAHRSLDEVILDYLITGEDK